ncbi:MAG: 4'-phosphopantetheinyl transferase [Pseudomonadales bacterium]|nr:4'-phosphopantetheinyl transferase [Pseudomonadales bacterium]
MNLKSLFPADVIWGVAEAWMWEQPLCPDEEALIARAVDKRKREFRAGRHCAHALLHQVGANCDALLKGRQREPAWPAGWVGSITHSGEQCVVAIASSRHYHSIGLDVEQASPLGEDIRDLICSPGEQDQIAKWQLLSGQDLASSALSKVIFSAKESVHKVYFPLNYHTLDFLDAQVELHPPTGGFVARILRPEPAPQQPIHELQGRYLVASDYVATFIGLRREAP